MNTVNSLNQGLDLASFTNNGHSQPTEDVSIHDFVLGEARSFAANVVDFNQRVLGIQQRPIGMLNDAEYTISIKSLDEELVEFQEARGEGDLIGMIDAMVDLQYFAIGVLYKLGLTPESIDAAMGAVHSANMEKKLGVNARRGDGSAADAVKPADWTGPEERISKILDIQIAQQ